jgi:hypothetical protein
VWSQLVASGKYFADMSNPQVMLKVGLDGQTGTVEISDIIFTSIGALPGLVMLEWNMGASTQGSVSSYSSLGAYRPFASSCVLAMSSEASSKQSPAPTESSIGTIY